MKKDKKRYELIDHKRNVTSYYSEMEWDLAWIFISLSSFIFGLLL